MISEKNIFDNFTKQLDDTSNNKYLLQKGVLYFYGIINHDFAKIIDGNIYIKFNITTKKYSLKLIKYCKKNNITEDKIKLVTDIFPEKSYIDFDDYHWNNINNMFFMYCKEDIFYFFKEIEFNFAKSLANYLNDLNIVSVFKEFCDKSLIKKYIGKEDKYHKNFFWQFLKKDWIIENSEIRNDITNIFRKIKILIMLKNDNTINE